MTVTLIFMGWILYISVELKQGIILIIKGDVKQRVT